MSGLRIRQPGAWSPSQHSQAPAGAAKLGGRGEKELPCSEKELFSPAVASFESISTMCTVCVCVCVYDTHTQELYMFLFMYLYFSTLNFTYHLIGLL